MSSTRNSRRIELGSVSTLQTPNRRVLPPAGTSCAGLFSKGDLRYEYNISRLEQKYCSAEKQRERHYLVVDLNTLELVPNEDKLDEDEEIDADPDEVRQLFAQDVHDAFVVPFGQHDIATPADDHSPIRKKVVVRSSRRSTRSISPARSAVNMQFEKFYSKQRRQGTHFHKQQLCRPSKRHSIEACLSSSGIAIKKSRDLDTSDVESNASRLLHRRIEEDFGDDNHSMRSGFAPPPKAPNALREKQIPSTMPRVNQPSSNTVITRNISRRENSRVESVRSSPADSRKSKRSLGYDEMLNIDADRVVASSAVVRSVYNGQGKSTVTKRTNKKEKAEASRMAAGGDSPIVATRLVRHSILVEFQADDRGTLDGRILGAQSNRLPGRIYMSRDQWRAAGGADVDDDNDDTVSMHSGFVTPGMRIVSANIRRPSVTDNWNTSAPQLQTSPSSSSELAIVEPHEERPKRQTTLRKSLSSSPTCDSPRSYTFVTTRKPKNLKRQTPKTMNRRDQKALECSISLGESACSDRSDSPNISGELGCSFYGRQMASSGATAAAKEIAIDCWISSVRRASETGQFDEDDDVRRVDRTIRQQHACAKQRNLYNNVGYSDN